MGQLSIILIAGFLCLFAYEIPETEDIEEINTIKTLLWTFLLTLGPVLIAYIVTSVVPRVLKARKIITDNIFSDLGIYRFVVELLCLGAFFINLFIFDLPLYVHLHLLFFPFFELRQSLATLPLIISLIGVRLVFHQLNRNSGIRYSELISFHLKFLLIPLIPLLIYLTTLDLLVRLPDNVLKFLGEHSYLLIGLLVPVLAGAYIFAPLLMQFMWKTTPLTDVVLREKLEKLTEKSKTKYKDIAVWQTGSLLIANAAVAGTLHWNRRIFLTDALLQYFSDDQIETIVAHELGHIRYKHIPTYVLFSLLYLLSYPLFYSYIEQPFFGLLPKSLIENYPVVTSIGSLIFFILYFIFGFRYISRRFEHQADLYAVSLTNKPEVFISALERLAIFNSIPITVRRIIEIFNTHPSIHRRVDIVNCFIKDDDLVRRYQDYLLEAKILVLLLPIFLVIVLILFL